VLLVHFALPALLAWVSAPLLAPLLAPWISLSATGAVASILVNRLLAEILTNLHSFLVIVPNHAGDDLWRFDRPTTNKGEYFLRQILGSANFRTGGQIEHHLWPDLPMAACARAQPRVRALCAQHGVPYVQQSVWRRVWKTMRVMVGQETMLRETRTETPEPETAG
jgi:fatty acid desaturase